MGRPKKEKPTHGNYYEYKITVGRKMDGTPLRKAFYSTVSKADAKAKADAYKIEHAIRSATGEGFIDRTITFEDFAAKWLLSVRGTVKDSTWNLTHRNSVENHLIPYFGSRKMADISQMDIQIFFNTKGKERSLESLKKYKMCLGQIFESAVVNKIIPTSPVVRIKLNSDIKPIKKRVYNAEDVSRVLQFAQTHRFGLEVQFLLRLGLRRGELLGIQWRDIDEEGRVLHIRRGVTDVSDPVTREWRVVVDDELKTAYSERDIPMPDDLLAQIKKRPHPKDTSEFVFCNQYGEVCSPDTWSDRHYKKFMTEMVRHYAGLTEPIEMEKLTPHELRHTCASLLVNADKNLFAIASVLGWANLKMLRERYAHGDIESIREQLDL